MRRVWSAIVTVIATILACISCVLTRIVSPGGRLGALMTRYWGRAVLWGGGIKTPVAGRENVRGGPFVIVANHSSMLDICISAAAVPVVFHFVSRPFFFKIPFLGWGMYLARHVSADPKKPREAARVLAKLGERFEKGLSLLMFPEGTRSPDGSVQRYKRGPFRTAIENGVAILPVHLDGVTERLPKGSFRLVPGEVRVTIGAPIETEGADARELAKRVEDWTRQQAEERA